MTVKKVLRFRPLKAGLVSNKLCRRYLFVLVREFPSPESGVSFKPRDTVQPSSGVVIGFRPLKAGLVSNTKVNLANEIKQIVVSVP